MSYDINILVNGNRCKQYNHNGRIFIEAKEGSEYAIEIKNNTWKRILGLCSVDGLDIITGKTATSDAGGYVISGMNSCKFDGFRFSNDKVAKFVFSFKDRNDGYAASKEDGSEKNVGVIGVRLYLEKEKPAPIVIREEHHHHHDHYPSYPNRPWWGSGTPSYPSYPTIWCDATYSTSMDSGMADMQTYTSNAADNSGPVKYDATLDSSKKRSFTKSINNASSQLKGSNKSMGKITSNAMQNASPLRGQGFDMATKWGEAKESRVVEVEFERGLLALTTNIYYASRQSLLDMGVPLGNEKQVSFPEAFADSKYAKPPKNWVG